MVDGAPAPCRRGFLKEPSMSESFEVRVVWPADERQKMPPDPAFSRDNWLAAPGKPEVPGSSPAVFGGDPRRYNPEELLMLSLSQCHLLTYLAIAAKRQIHVVHYDDRAVGRLGKNAEGRMQMMEVILRPHVVLAKGADVEEARALHAKAHAACFMANSVNFPVTHEPDMRVQE
jgi:organic hydroperoxide reductase OsmC/OhrA